MITTKKTDILKIVAMYTTLTRMQIQRVCGEKNDRVMRKRLLELCQERLLSKARQEVLNPSMTSTAPVYFSSRKGLEFLACELDDTSWLQCCSQTPNWQMLLHWTTVAEFHIRLDQAIAMQRDASLGGWLGEWDIANSDESAPHNRYRLFTLISERPRLVCVPDAAFLLCVNGFAKIHYVEVDRATSGINSIAHSKTPGFAALAEHNLHRRHFETNTDSFFVLSVSPTAARRDALRKAIASKRGAELWKFAAWPDLRPETVIHGPVWYRCHGEGQPLVRPNASPAKASMNGSALSPAQVRIGSAADQQGG